MNKNNILKDLLSNRKGIFEIIIVAISFAFGINLITNEIKELVEWEKESLIFTLIGIFICVISICYFLFRIYKQKEFSKIIEGFFIIDKADKTIVDIDGYDYGEDLKRSFDSAFSEDESIKIAWENNNLTPRFRLGKNSPDSLNLIIEATEYFFLEKLSTHLTDYFNKEKIDKKLLVELLRDDIPDILLKNRFLELFSKSTERRVAFLKEKNKNDSNVGSELVTKQKLKGKVVSSYSASAMFRHFDLTLPPKSSISRTSNNAICIDTKRFKIDVKVEFDAFNTVTPRGFTKYYLKKENSETNEYQIDLILNVRFKLGGFVSRNGWDYYKWIDSFFDKIESSFSQSTFFERIGWDKAYVIIKALDKKQ